MLKNLLITFILFVFNFGLSARELKVESFKLAPTDQSAVVNPRIDLNGDTCALIRVEAGIAGCSFDNIVGDAQRRDGIYLVYVPQGTKRLSIKHKDHDNLIIEFGSVSDIKSLKSSATYDLKLISIDNSKASDFNIFENYECNLKVTKLELLQTDISARTNERFDKNGNRCALIKVALPIPNCEFEGVVGSADFHINEYWVYLSPESPSLVIGCPGFSKFSIDASCFSVDKSIVSGQTYRLSLSGFEISLVKFTDRLANALSNYDDVRPVDENKRNNGLYVANKDGLEGLINIEGKVIIPCKYDHISSVGDGAGERFNVIKGGKRNILNLEGKELFPWIYDVCIYYDGFCIVGNDDHWRSSIVGVVRLDGTEVIPCKYDAREFDFTGESFIVEGDLFDMSGRKIRLSHSGYIEMMHNRYGDSDMRVLKVSSDGKEFFVDKKGQRVNSYMYDEVPPTLSWGDGACYYECELQLVKRNGKFGYVDHNGKEVILPIYDDATNFMLPVNDNGEPIADAEGYAFTYLSGRGLQIIDPSGTAIARFGTDISILKNEGVGEEIISPKWCPEAKVLIQEYEGKVRLLDDRGEELLPYINEKFPANENLFSVNKNGKWGYVTANGREVIPCIYNYCNAFNNGFAKVELNSRYGIINTRGEQITPCKYDYISDFANGLAKVKLNSRYGIINTQGEQIIPCKYDYISDFANGLAKIEKDGKKGFINIRGDELWFGGND